MTCEVKIIADSISPAGKRITTLQLKYWRAIHSELMTHRVFSRNASSSRAIPVAKVIEQVRENPAGPTHWGKNQAGMQAQEECTEPVMLKLFTRPDDGREYGNEWYEERVPHSIQDAWAHAAGWAADMAQAMSLAGYHKQIVNRILEPFQFMNTIVTATEWDNFFELRCHKDAQPEFQELACAIRDAMAASTPQQLNYGEWHLPYVDWERNGEMTLSDALIVSASCCAQVSYRKLDDSLGKAREIYQRLVESRPAHSSPFEHQATPMQQGGDHLCGNFIGWVQHRKLLEHEDHWLDEALEP